MTMCQQRILLCFSASFLLIHFPPVSTDFRAFGNLPNEFLLTDDTPSDHLVGKVRAPLGTPITFPPIGPPDGRLQPLRFQIFRPHKIPGRLFRIDPESGELYTRQIIDREVLCPENEASECTLGFQVTVLSKSASNVPQFIDVKVLLVDRNDHVPEFPDPGFVNLSVSEAAEVGARFSLPLARDPDSRQYSVNAYVAEPEMPSEWSLVTETTGGEEENFIYSKVAPSSPPTSVITGLYLKLQKPLDHETRKKFSFRLRALDCSETSDVAPASIRKDTLQVYIYVEDVNDNGPIFRPQGKSYSSSTSNAQLSSWMVTYTATVPESKWVKDPILKLVADDLDGPAHSKVGYYFAPGTSKQVQEYFTLNPLNGYLSLRKPLDYELQSEYSFRVIATDVPGESAHNSMVHGPLTQASSNLHTATAQVVVTVTDANDEAPEIEVDFISNEPSGSPLAVKYAEIEENVAPPQFIASIRATDRDAGPSGQVSCVQQPVVNPASSLVVLWPGVAAGANSTSSPFQLDEIRQESGRVQYRLLTREVLDREDIENGGAYRQVKIICTDMGRPPRSSSAFVNIRIRDKNDNAPIIHLRRPPDYVNALKPTEGDKWPHVYENAPVGSLVIRLNASDPDEGENGRLSFSFLSDEPLSGAVNPLNLFQINEKTGDITTRVEIDREAYDPPLTSVGLKVRVVDNGIPPKSTTQEVRIYIRDENDNDPVFQRSEYQFHVMENLPAGYAIGEILVTDKDEGEVKLSFGMQTYGPLPFTIRPSPIQGGNEHGEYPLMRFILNTTRPLDREVEHKFKFTLLATDGPGGHGRSRVGTATATVEVIVENENDNDPVIIFPQKQNKTFYLSCRERKNFELLTINANDKDPSENPHIFELMKGSSDMQMTNYSSENDTKRNGEFTQISDFLDIEPTAGIVFLSRDMRAEDKGVHVFKVQVTDAGVPPRYSSITFFVLVDDSSPRSPLPESSSPVSKRDGRPAVSVERAPPRDSGLIFPGNHVGNRKPPSEIKHKQKPRIAGDLIVLLALGLVFLLLVATLGLVVYFRYWKKQARFAQASGNRDSLLFANRVNRGGSTCMKEIRVPPSKHQEQWLCAGDGSIISVSSPSQILNDGDQLKNHFPTVISSSHSTGNIYYKAKADATAMGRGESDSGAAYSPLSPMNSVLLKPNLVPGCDGYLQPESQLAYYAQNIHVLGGQSKDRSTFLPHRNTMDRNTFRNTSAIKQQQQQQQQREVLMIPSVAWDCQSRSDSPLKQEELVLVSPSEGERGEAQASLFCSPFA